VTTTGEETTRTFAPPLGALSTLQAICNGLIPLLLPASETSPVGFKGYIPTDDNPLNAKSSLDNCLSPSVKLPSPIFGM
jgi:hypothetical protein